jgi:RHS repeat-associated protein
MTSSLPSGQGYTRLELNFKYDYLGRRVEKEVENLDGPTPNFTHRCVYDGWNLVAEYGYASSTLSLIRSYTWGLDITGASMRTAGGVGALLQIADHPSGKTYLPAYDGNGNIAALLNASTGSVAAAYEYSPFGEPLRTQTSDQSVADNPFRFSTRYTDVETGLVYYGHRYYDAKNGRFINRDPIEESGGLNLYGFCGNDAVNGWDVLGLDGVTATDYGTFMASVTDALGQIREWNFSSETDAWNWVAAWKQANVDLLQPYLQQMAANDLARRMASIASDPVTATIYLQGIPGIGAILRSTIGGLGSGSENDSDDAQTVTDAISQYGASYVFTVYLGNASVAPQAHAITLVVGGDSSIIGGLNGSDKARIVDAVNALRGFLGNSHSYHISINLLFSNTPTSAPPGPYVFDLTEPSPGIYVNRCEPAENAVRQLRGTATGVIPIVLTERGILSRGAENTPSNFTTAARAVMYNRGILWSRDDLDNPFILAHELGHLGDYQSRATARTAPGLASHAPALLLENLMHEFAARKYRAAEHRWNVYADGDWLTAMNRVARGFPPR